MSIAAWQPQSLSISVPQAFVRIASHTHLCTPGAYCTWKSKFIKRFTTEVRPKLRGEELRARLEEQGIYVRSASYAGLAEEAGAAYKDIDEVVRATAEAGLSLPVVKLVPVGNIKG